MWFARDVERFFTLTQLALLHLQTVESKAETSALLPEKCQRIFTVGRGGANLNYYTILLCAVWWFNL